MRGTGLGIAVAGLTLLLAVPVGGIDLDGNGLSDVFEAEFSIPPGADPDSDWDGDARLVTHDWGQVT